MNGIVGRALRRARSSWEHFRCRMFLRTRVTGRIKLRGEVSRIEIDPSFRCDGDLWLGVYSPEGKITIEAGVSASGPLIITAIRPLRVCSGALFGPNVFVTDHYHGDRRNSEHMDMRPSNRPLFSPGTVTIEQNTLFGVNSVVLGPARVGERAVIAANAVVKGDVTPRSVYVGLGSHRSQPPQPHGFARP